MSKGATYILLLLISSSITVHAQNKIRFPIWTFNTDSTTILGISVGYTHTDKIKSVKTNGIRIEAVGAGLLIPLIPNVPEVGSDSSFNIIKNVKAAEIVNGINLSPIGHGGDISVNGLNLYGCGSLITKSNGISLGSFVNVSARHNGIQIAGLGNHTYNATGLQISMGNSSENNFAGIQLGVIANTNGNKTFGIQIGAQNETKELHGLQIGVWNKSKKVKGLQLGLWNINEKRKLPFINW